MVPVRLNLRSFLVLSLFALFALPSKATHYSGGEIYYKWSPTASDSSRYEVFVNWYRNNGGANIFGNTQAICITSSCFADVNVTLNRVMPPAGQASPNDANGGWVVPGLDECANNTDPSYKDLSIHKFSGFASLPGTCGNFNFTANAPCCRDVSTNLATSPNMYLEAGLNNTLGESSSPEIQAPAAKAFCLTQPGARPFEFIQSAIDLDGDSIRYRFGHPQSGAACGPGTNIPYSPGYNVNNPFPSSTGIVIDQTSGIFTFSPSQQGSYVVKVVVEDWRFDIGGGFHWVKIGESVRELQIPVTANCNPASAQGPRLSLTSATNNASVQNYTRAQIDSMKNAYNMAVFFGEDSIPVNNPTVFQVPVFQGYQCFDSIVSIEFGNNIRCSSVDPTDFRLIGPDGVARPVVQVETNCQFLVSRNLDLKLNQPLDVDGNYILQIRRGNDGTSLVNECGIELSEFYTIIIPVNGCPSPSYDLDGVTVERDVDVRLDWSGNTALQDPAVLATFNAWNIYRADAGARPFTLLHVLDDPSARFTVDSFDQNGFFVDNFSYDYQVQLVYNGKGRRPTRYCSTIQLQIDSDQRSDQNLPLYWNHYNCIDVSVRNYDLFRGKRDTSIAAPGVRTWDLLTQTTDTIANISIPKADSLNEGTYVARVVARNVNGATRVDSSESNWIYYFITYFPPVVDPEPDLVGEVIIPNVITPNEDGINDRFFIEAPIEGVSYQTISVSLYNRHGERVFQDENFAARNTRSLGWEGVNNAGQPLASGVYFYIIEMNNPATGESQTLQGNLTLNVGSI